MALTDKSTIITGGAGGIGFACAERFAKEGARIMIADVDVENGEAAAARLRDAGGDVQFRRTDTGNKSDVDGLVADTVEAFGRVDVLINNAAILRMAGFLDITEDDFDDTVRVNLKGYFLCGQAVARQMVAQGEGGAIVNMSSVQAVLSVPTILPYVVCKGGVNQLTTSMSVELATENIRVNAIGPGTILTEMAKSLLSDEAARHKVLSRTPVGRCGDPEEIASIAVFLASEESSYVTGQCIYADGGRLGLNYTVPVAEGAGF
ncbi:MAG: SDR family oxidoreductase [Rhodospirillales bacterium]|jgi:glucose 1-dehydrogenase|nr:SDR family oxidoreductase [Rhodospirillales bacterium]MBT4039492.1 SDR family oxidoreductase [Rhodospirillales bacterium]MBT4627129.1 SDR family oxidoreductase [Rhodospirillales bacterium]MBT5351131.1 SDR family oxidoreductase [Rhodospirillales bacterium]MBT5520474.1 SDR family oxidoreductase [Rhodospirillales bacterium]